MKKVRKVKIGMTTEQRDERRLTDEVMLCPKCSEHRPIRQFSTKKAGKDKLHYLAAECNKCQYKRKLNKHGGMTSQYNKTQLEKELNTIEGRASRIYYNVRNRCRQSKRNIVFDLKKETILRMLKPMKCMQTGVSLELGELGANPYSPSLDRIDSNLGYTDNNVQITAQIYNFAKNQYSDEDVIEFIKRAKV